MLLSGSAGLYIYLSFVLSFFVRYLFCSVGFTCVGFSNIGSFNIGFSNIGSFNIGLSNIGTSDSIHSLSTTCPLSFRLRYLLRYPFSSSSLSPARNASLPSLACLATSTS
uniref:pentapeptide repeat-containing protein n=1 Tax=Lactobacillus jensenii TaxID=109790 RepID=UPI0035BE1382